jgi:hypothetical protein
MAYMSQERKAQIAPVIKAILKRYGVKGSLAVDNHTSLVLNIKSGPIDFIGNANEVAQNDFYAMARGFQTIKDSIQVNVYHYQTQYSGKALAFLNEVVPALNVGNHDRSDIMTDYFDVGWYVNVNIGKWNKPYKLEE